jgi:protein SCO1/2
MKRLPKLAVAVSLLLMIVHGAMAEDAAQCLHHDPLAAAEPLPGQSLYNLKAALTDQYGKPLSLDAFRGQVVLVTMFYSSCTSICPMLIAQLRHVEAQLPANVRSATPILLVSLDPERDTPAKLLALEQLHKVDGKRWHFTRTVEASVRKIAALLGVRYRKLDDGTIGHSPVIAVLDRNGVLVTRIEGTAGDPKVIADAVVRASAKTPSAAKP